jgi:hypothetical protein
MKAALAVSIAAKFGRVLMKRKVWPGPYSCETVSQSLPLFCRLAAAIFLATASNWPSSPASPGR